MQAYSTLDPWGWTQSLHSRVWGNFLNGYDIMRTAGR